MTLFRCALILSLIAVACSSPEPKQSQEPEQQNEQASEFPNLISLKQPGEQEIASSKVYVDTIKWVDQQGKNVLLISGNLPNGCTYIKGASHAMTDDSLKITLDAWKPAEKMCTQAMVPFSFIYDKLEMETANTYSKASVNGKPVTISKE